MTQGRSKAGWGMALAVAVLLSACAPIGLAPVPPPPGPVQHGQTMPEREVLVTVRRDASIEPATRAHWIAARYGLELVTLWPLPSLGVDCFMYRLAEGEDREAVMARLAADPEVEAVQPMLRHETSQGAPDPMRDLQPGFAPLNLERAHRLATGRGVLVAVIDTGVDATHPDLRIEAARDFVDEAATAPPAETHGTAVTGVIGAVAGNGLGIAGVAPGARVLGLRGCWQGPKGGQCTSFTLARAMQFAISAGARVVNLSLQGPRDPLLARLIAAGQSQGMVVVAARDPSAQGAFPASEPGVLAVRRDGEAPPPGRPTLPAPGTDIVSAAPGGGYGFFTGSSFAAAHVTGVVALLREAAPSLPPEGIAAALGQGPIDACRAILAARNGGRRAQAEAAQCGTGPAALPPVATPRAS